MMNGGASPLTSAREMHPLNMSHLKPATTPQQKSTRQNRVNSETKPPPLSERLTAEEKKPRVKSEKRLPSSQMLTKQEQEDAQLRRKSFPPIAKSHASGGKTTSTNSQQPMSEVVARMRFREKTLQGEGLLTGMKLSSEAQGNDRPVNGFVSPLHNIEHAAPQTPKVPPFSPTEIADLDLTPRFIKTRKNGVVMPLRAWVTPRDPFSASFEIRGSPIFIRSVSVRHGALIADQQNALMSGQGHLFVTGQCEEEEKVEDVVEDTGANGGSDSDDESFDFDEGEDEVEAEKKDKRESRTTSAVYQRACNKAKLPPFPAFLRQCNVSGVDLCDKGLGPVEVKPIAIALVRDSRIFSLNLSNNELGALGVCYIAEMLQENRTLFDLNLSGTNPGREGIKALSETLVHNRTLLFLRLEDNNLEYRDAQLLADIIRTVPNLQGLYLGHNKLGYHGAISIAAALSQNKSLLTLDLQWNHIRRESGVALIKALAINSRLRQLNLAWNGLGKEGCLALGHVLPINKTLLELDLTCNRVDLTSLGFLLQGLAKNTKLTSLKIGQNPITTQGATALLETVTSSEHIAITDIDLTGVPVDKAFIQLVTDAQKTRFLHVKHEEARNLAIGDLKRAHEGTDLDRYDPVMVFFEFVKMDNLRVVDIFQFMDTKKRDKLSKANIRDGLNTLRLPVTEHAIDVIHDKLDVNRDGYVELDEMMRVQRETARQVKVRQIKAKWRKREDESLNKLHDILRDVIAKRQEHNESRRGSMSQSRSQGQFSRASAGAGAGAGAGGGAGGAGGGAGGRRRSSGGPLLLKLTKQLMKKEKARKAAEENLATIPDESQ